MPCPAVNIHVHACMVSHTNQEWHSDLQLYTYRGWSLEPSAWSLISSLMIKSQQTKNTFEGSMRIYRHHWPWSIWDVLVVKFMLIPNLLFIHLVTHSINILSVSNMCKLLVLGTWNTSAKKGKGPCPHSLHTSRTR